MPAAHCIWILLFIAHLGESSPLPRIRLTFSTSVVHNYTESGPDASPAEHEVFSLASSEAHLALMQQNVLLDGRAGETLSLFREMHRYAENPFFDSMVCYKFELSSLPYPAGANASEMWQQATLEQLGLYQDLLPLAREAGSAKIDGKPCTMWEHTDGDDREPETTMVAYRFCIDATGALLHVNNTNSYRNPDLFVSTHIRSFQHYDPHPTADMFSISETCVDLTSGKPVPTSALVNDKQRLALANAESGGYWQAAASPIFEGLTLADAQRRMGTKIRPLDLPLNLMVETQDTEQEIPASFDARTTWAHCPSIGTIRNQGSCGSCWAFAAAEVFADRLCIGGSSVDFTASVQYMLDCDGRDNACNGGLLDDAWKFLHETGVTSEACDPYQYCPNPELQNCSFEASNLHDTPSVLTDTSCPSVCKSGAPLHRVRARSAYAVAKPGDVEGMQREIMRRGSIEVSFFVFSDFMTYSSGTYFRTTSANGPQGGHAVRILGWGVDEHNVDYWLVANSWSTQWGEHGFFRIRRGTNECGIETTPAAGVVDAAELLHGSGIFI